MSMQSNQHATEYGDMYHEFTAQSCPRQTTIYRNGKEWMRISRRVAGGEDMPTKVSEIVKALNTALEVEDGKVELIERRKETFHMNEELQTMRRDHRWMKHMVENMAITIDKQAAALEHATSNRD